MKEKCDGLGQDWITGMDLQSILEAKPQNLIIDWMQKVKEKGTTSMRTTCEQLIDCIARPFTTKSVKMDLGGRL